MPTKLLTVKRTPNASKAFAAEFEKDGRRYIRRFGTASNYVLNPAKTKADRAAYRKRHRAMKAEARALSDPMSPAALSMHLLWGESRSLAANIRAFKKSYGV